MLAWGLAQEELELPQMRLPSEIEDEVTINAISTSTRIRADARRKRHHHPTESVGNMR